jgi:pyruvate/2-oxoglutarate dehydrogenase complex dihydrolipoamide acyltransferase (E2) component
MGIYEQLEELNSKPASIVQARVTPTSKKASQPPAPTPPRPTSQTPKPTARMLARKHARMHASETASNADSLQADSHADRVERIRRTVKLAGKEVTYVRLTPEEKRRLATIVFSYKQQGINTSESVISRIAVNYLLEDYARNKEASVPARVMAALFA